MRATLISQPASQLGTIVEGFLSEAFHCQRATLVSAFVSLRTVLRLRQPILAARDRGCAVSVIVGIDLDGTSREALQELISWAVNARVFSNASPRSTFHPKAYLFESRRQAALFVGSNNLTEGGFYTNHELAVRMDFDFPDDRVEFDAQSLLLERALAGTGGLIKDLDQELLDVLTSREQIPSESQRRQISRRRRMDTGDNVAPNPFGSVSAPLPPLLSGAARDVDAETTTQVAIEQEVLLRGVRLVYEKSLVWKKVLSRTDALQSGERANPVGGVRLTQAGFEAPEGRRIDQTKYFRELFSDYVWQREIRGHRDQEHAIVPIRLVIDDNDHGVLGFEISHKPSGEAGQGNYTTILRWGKAAAVVKGSNIAGKTLSLFETNSDAAAFTIEIG